MFADYSNGMQVIELRGVLLGTLAQWNPDAWMQTWQVATGNGRITIAIPSSDTSHGLLSQALLPHRFRLVQWDWPHDAAETPMLVEVEQLYDAFGTEFLPSDQCPVPGVLQDAIDLARSIAAEPLRRFVHDVLEERSVCARFWTMPASMRHHHAHPGGLAQHSVEVAEDIAMQGQLSEIERDLGIAGGLLHDIGKVWAYTPDMFPSAEGLSMGHELTGLTRLEPHLRGLEAHWSDGAFAMRVLLSGCGRMRADGSMPSALVARIRACDQRSCERSGGNPLRAGRSWVPKAWQPESF